MKLAIMCGLPRSGKSTFINENLKHYQIICKDDIRLALGFVYNQDLEDIVEVITNALIKASLIRGLDTVIDETNTTQSRRKKLISMGKEYNAEMILYFVKTSYEACIERAKQYGFPLAVITRMKQNLENEPPSEDEGINIIEISH